MSKPTTEVWAGLIEVQPQPGNDIFDNAPGAFCNVLGLAGAEAEYRHLAGIAFLELGLTIRAFENVESLGPWENGPRLEDDVPEEFLDLVKQLSPTSRLVHSIFYVYENEFDA